MTTTELERQTIERDLRENRAGIVPRVKLEVRDVDNARRRIYGRAVPYGVEIDTGWYKETIAPGCFTKSIQEAARGLPLLLFHDSRSMGSLVGVNESWQETRAGLDGIWLLDDDDQARQAADKAESGSLGYMSVGFLPRSGEAGSEFTWDENDDLHVLRKEARLMEVSLTPTPAYSDAVVTKVRHRASVPAGTPALDSWKKYLATVR